MRKVCSVCTREALLHGTQHGAPGHLPRRASRVCAVTAAVCNVTALVCVLCDSRGMRRDGPSVRPDVTAVACAVTAQACVLTCRPRQASKHYHHAVGVTVF